MMENRDYHDDNLRAFQQDERSASNGLEIDCFPRFLLFDLFMGIFYHEMASSSRNL
jgi:hypothetical protein